MMRFFAKGLVAASLTLAIAASPSMAQPQHGLSLFGDLKYPANFQHFDYVNPDAPKGGTVKFAATGTFNTLNTFQLIGDKPAGESLIFDTLMTQASDEPASSYGLVAQSVEVAPDKTSVIYTLRPEAKFQDGSKITPDDVVWTFDTLKTKGHPRYKLYYADVLTAEKVGGDAVKFTFRNGDNRELPSIVGEMPVLSKAAWSKIDFDKPLQTPPLGSGPYKIASFEIGRSITYQRDPNYWGKDLPVNRGRFNFDTERYDYYRDPSIALEAFKAGQFDIRVENVAKNWAVGYDSPALTAGLIKKEKIANQVPQGMQGFGFNTRNPLFQDPKVRDALTYLFDFEWANHNLFYDAYTRSRSYFSNSELAATGTPSPDELKLLEPFKGQIPDEVFTTEYNPPKTDGSGDIRENLRTALKLLGEAGWSVKSGKLVNTQGQPFHFEFLLSQDQADFERVVLPFAQNLKRIGIDMSVRSVDPAQFQNRIKSFDYDMLIVGIGESLSPGNEQRDYWTSAAAAENGSQNYMGIKNKAIDALVDDLINAKDRASLVTATHALDRVLTWGHYVIPNWYLPYFRVAMWDKFERPKISPPYDLPLDTWWIAAQKAQDVEAKKPQVEQRK
ncbi:MAG TPA: extracellular solute-binding protein [Stellaceae bacterium]|jgi:microcin C transport system substrate-binding protein|nr:extracellular solute-binding protein [Stellaceae bacterium]